MQTKIRKPQVVDSIIWDGVNKSDVEEFTKPVFESWINDRLFYVIYKKYTFAKIESTSIIIDNMLRKQ